jgi:hypothetical protein
MTTLIRRMTGASALGLFVVIPVVLQLQFPSLGFAQASDMAGSLMSKAFLHAR